MDRRPNRSGEYEWTSAEAQDDHEYTLPAIISLLPPGSLKILDAGCGNGYIASRLAGLGHAVTGIDVSTDGIRLARNEYPGVRYEICSVYDPLDEIVQDVDVVVASEVIEHLYAPQRFLENVRTVIRSGGSLILTTPYHGYLKNLALSVFNKWDGHHTVAWEGGHIKFFSEKTLASMLAECGFSNVVFNNAGRVRWLWKSMVCRAEVDV